MLLRQVTRSRSLCAASHLTHPRHLYASHALAYAAVDHIPAEDHSSAGTESTAGPSNVIRKPRAKKASKSKADSTDTLPKRAKAKKSVVDSVPRKDPLADNAIDIYLEQIEEAKTRPPTLEDIERLRPRTHTFNIDSQQYADEYHALVDKICRSFSREQLQAMQTLYNIGSRRSMTKMEYAEMVIEKVWNWPSLKEVQKEHRDRTEISVKSRPR